MLPDLVDCFHLILLFLTASAAQFKSHAAINWIDPQRRKCMDILATQFRFDIKRGSLDDLKARALSLLSEVLKPHQNAEIALHAAFFSLFKNLSKPKKERSFAVSKDWVLDQLSKTDSAAARELFNRVDSLAASKKEFLQEAVSFLKVMQGWSEIPEETQTFLLKVSRFYEEKRNLSMMQIFRIYQIFNQYRQ